MSNIHEDIRELHKWLNEEQMRPINKTGLARVLAYAQGISGKSCYCPNCEQISAQLKAVKANVAGGSFEHGYIEGVADGVAAGVSYACAGDQDKGVKP